MNIATCTIRWMSQSKSIAIQATIIINNPSKNQHESHENHSKCHCIDVISQKQT